MKIVTITTLLIALALAPGCSKGESYTHAGYNFANLDKVAVIEVAGAVEGETAKNQIADFFGMELLKKGYSPIERAQAQALLNEQDFQASDMTSPENVAKVGKILNVPVVLVVNIPTYYDEMNMTAKMMDVETGRLLWMGSASADTGKNLITILGAVGGAIAGTTVAGEDSDDKILGGVIGGVAGGLIGRELTPQQAEQVQKMTKKMCKALPPRFGPKK